MEHTAFPTFRDAQDVNTVHVTGTLADDPVVRWEDETRWVGFLVAVQGGSLPMPDGEPLTPVLLIKGVVRGPAAERMLRWTRGTALSITGSLDMVVGGNGLQRPCWELVVHAHTIEQRSVPGASMAQRAGRLVQRVWEGLVLRGRQRGLNGLSLVAAERGVRVRPRASRAGWMGLGLAVMLTSCIPVTERMSVGPEERRIGVSEPSGPPQATLHAHADHEGWTVTVRQPMRRQIEVTSLVKDEHRYYYLNPITIPIGMVGCASGVWATAFTALAPLSPNHRRQELLHQTVDACLMAVMINQSGPKRTDARTVVANQDTTEMHPLKAGRVTMQWHGGSRPVVVPYPLDSEGRAVIRLSHLATALQQAGFSLVTAHANPVELVTWHDTRVLARWQLPVPADALWAAVQHGRHVAVPPERWPTPLITRVLMHDGMSPSRRWEARFIRTLVEEGVPVVAPEETQLFLRQEMERNLQGLVDDSTVGPGHWLAPTVALDVSVERDAHSVSVGITVLNLRTQEVLAQLLVPAGPREDTEVLDVALWRTGELFRAVQRAHASRR